MRITRPLLTTGALITALSLGLSACGSDEPKKKDTKDGKAAPATCEDVESGDTSDSVEVTGDFGKKHTAKFKSPLKASGIERTILDEGDGEEPKEGSEVNILLTLASGKTGKTLGTQAVKFPVGNAEIPDAFRAAVECVPFGTRSVITVPVKDVYGPEGNPQAQLAADDSMVIVADVIDVVKPLKPAEWKDAPAVTFDDKGVPTVKLEGKPSTELLLKVLEEGDGKVVKKGDQVTVNYQGTVWNATKKKFDSSYGDIAGKPASPATFGTDQVVPGFGAALVGQKVGSKIVVTIPAEHGYGPSGGNAQAGIGPKDTIVFVIEIKDTKGA